MFYGPDQILASPAKRNETLLLLGFYLMLKFRALNPPFFYTNVFHGKLTPLTLMKAPPTPVLKRAQLLKQTNQTRIILRFRLPFASSRNSPVDVEDGLALDDIDLPFSFPADQKPINSEGKVVLTTHSKGPWNESLIADPTRLHATVVGWVNQCNVIFGLRELDIDKHAPDQGSLLQEMSCLSSRIYRTATFQKLLITTGLDILLELIGDPTNDFESNPHLAESYRLYRWRQQFNTFNMNWTPKDIISTVDWENARTHFFSHIFFKTNTVQMPVFPPENKKLDKGKTHTAQFFRAMSDNPDMIPKATNPSSVFIFIRRHNFMDAWELWLSHRLMRAGFNVSQWDVDKLYRDLMGLNKADIARWCQGKGITLDPDLNFLWDLSMEYRTIIAATAFHSHQPRTPQGAEAKHDRRKFDIERKAVLAQASAQPQAGPPRSDSPTSEALLGRALVLPVFPPVSRRHPMLRTAPVVSIISPSYSALNALRRSGGIYSCITPYSSPAIRGSPSVAIF
ncbi:hypothetical protein C8R44DRAFT_896009 [Mycena epipterygia]|nr:hypothetical protein C8R44DRAFT_896009 [Mycena epipterygia]